MANAPQPEFQSIPNKAPVDILFIAGEHSGDEHAAALLRKAKKENPELNIAAIGGEKLREAGAHLLFNPLESAVIGFIEVIKHFDYLKSVFNLTLNWIEENRPRLVCFVDYPGFNLRIAKQLFQRKVSKKGGGNVKLAFYISPQIWAWKAKRRFTMAKHLDALGVIFPFEVECYKDTKLKTTFVGHPFVDSDYKLPVSHNPDDALLLLPGSRRTPIQRIFPTMVGTYNLIKRDYPDLKAKVMYPTEKIKDQLLEIIQENGDKNDFELIPNSKTFSARAVLTSSGTISLVCALAAIPGLLVYRTNPLTYTMALILVKIRTIGIANIILGKPIHPEFLQAEMKPHLLYPQLKQQLENSENLGKTRKLSNELRGKLQTDSHQNASSWLLDLLTD